MHESSVPFSSVKRFRPFVISVLWVEFGGRLYEVEDVRNGRHERKASDAGKGGARGWERRNGGCREKI